MHRIVTAAPVQSKFNGKWSSVFKAFMTHQGAEYLSSEMESAPVWDNAGAAKAAGERALEVVNATGKFPNMCEIW